MVLPLSFFWGEEDFLIEKQINQLKLDFLDGEVNELNYRIYDNPEFCDFVLLLRTRPMIFGNVILNIKADRYFLEGNKKINLDDNQINEINDALLNLNEKVQIILTCQLQRNDKKKPDSRKKLYKTIAKNGKILEFHAFKPYEDYKVLPVLKSMAKDMDLKADNAALGEIISRTGVYLRDLDNALQRLKLYVYPNNMITKKTVENLYCASTNIFLLLDLILNKKYELVISEISNLLLNSHYLEILSFLQSGFSKILNTKVLSKTNAPSEIAVKTSQNEYAVKKTIEKTKNIDLNKIIRLKLNLTKAEYEIKTGEKEALTALMEAFIK